MHIYENIFKTRAVHSLFCGAFEFELFTLRELLSN